MGSKRYSAEFLAAGMMMQEAEGEVEDEIKRREQREGWGGGFIECARLIYLPLVELGQLRGQQVN